MASGWKAIERAVAALTSGTRTWDSRDAIDVITDEYAIEVKNVKGPTIAQCEAWLRHNEPKAAGRGLKNALIVKRRAGRGTPTPYLAVFPLGFTDENDSGKGTTE